MYLKMKRIGTLVFGILFVASFAFEGLRENLLVILLMLMGLIIAALGYYFEDKHKRFEKKMNATLFYNGRIYTMDSENSICSAIFIENGIIKDRGNDDIVKKYEKQAAEIINLHQKTVLPGLNDSHMHMYAYGESLRILDLTGAQSIDDMVALGREQMKKHSYDNKRWLQGRGWNQELFDNPIIPTMADLDRISIDIPIVFTRVCCHIAVVNSKAMDLMGISRNTVIEGGEIERDEEGNLTGIFKENALSFISKAQVKPSFEEVEETFRISQEKLLSYGITSVQTDDLQHTGRGWEDVIKVYAKLYEEGNLKLRINQQCLFFNIEDFNEFIERGAHGIKLNHQFKTGPLKLLGDGSLGARTAYLSKPYQDDPSKIGLTAYSDVQLEELLDKAYKNDIPVAIHAIGDHMMEMAMDAIKKTRENNNKQLRDGIVHCQITNQKIFEQFRALDMMAYIQPVFTVGDWKIVEKRIGHERAEESYNWKTLYDLGINISLGTDAPVESPNPFENIYVAVTRKDFDDQPDGGWLPNQKLTREQAIRGYTINAAYASGEENIKGTLEKGKLGDFIVISQDIFVVPENQIKDIATDFTVIGGKIAYKKQI
ncbi:MAG: amidohydrolase [Tissierellales bacterium]|nr:amidohydrolase [Tissierellales bacterium]MBN2827421.1 amidohydrolase [Tissierellales bacterium]